MPDNNREMHEVDLVLDDGGGRQPDFTDTTHQVGQSKVVVRRWKEYDDILVFVDNDKFDVFKEPDGLWYYAEIDATGDEKEGGANTADELLDAWFLTEE